MKISVDLRPTLRAALVASCSLLAGCMAGAVGPIGSADILSRMEDSYSADGRVNTAIPAQYRNERLTPSLGQAVFLEARNPLEPRAAGLTEKSLLILMWNQGRYTVVQRLPYDGIADIRRVGRFALEIETNEPRHVAPGQPEQTGLFIIAGLDPNTALGDSARTQELYTALLRKIQARRPDWRPSTPPSSAI